MKMVKYSLPILLLIFSVISFGSRTTAASARQTATAPPADADDLLIVDCLLPGQIRRLGKMVYQSRRRPIKTTARDCEIRGGEYVAFDRGNSLTALNVWLPQAKAGDQVAQTYVGEIFQEGLGVEPRYDLAAEWYRKAAENGFARAQMNLGFLYEKGLGVPKDPEKALFWYRKASGLGESITIDEGVLSTEERQELEDLRREVERYKAEREGLQHQLEQTREELDRTRHELENRESEILREKKELEQARAELQQKIAQATGLSQADLKKLEQELTRRENELENQQKEVARLQGEISRHEAEADNYRKKLTEFKQKLADLPEPFIEIQDPRIVATRGVRIAPIDLGETKHQIKGKVWAPAGLASFEVNGKQEEVKSDGIFKVQVSVQNSARTEVRIVAVDTRGKRAAVQFKLSPEQAAPPAVTEEKEVSSINFGPYYALVIGNNNYVRLPKLDSAVNDAQEVAEILRDKYRFKTTVLLNATRYEILDSLNKFLKKLTEKDNFLLYYAGHGERDPKNQRGFWLPVDAEPDSNANWIPTYAVTDILNNMSAKQIIVVADTCYSGFLTRSAIARLDPGMSEEARYNFLKAMTTKHSRMVLSSGEDKPVLDAGGGKHSVFAKALLQALESNNGILEGWKLYNQVSKFVTYASEKYGYQQVPQYAPIKFAGHESGDFFFVPIE